MTEIHQNERYMFEVLAWKQVFDAVVIKLFLLKIKIACF